MKCQRCPVAYPTCLGERDARLCDLAANDPAYARVFRDAAEAEHGPLRLSVAEQMALGRKAKGCVYFSRECACEYGSCSAGPEPTPLSYGDCHRCITLRGPYRAGPE